MKVMLTWIITYNNALLVQRYHLLLRRCNFYYVISIVAKLVLMFHILPLYEIKFEWKSIHICFSLKKGRSDMALYPNYMIMLYQYMK